MATPTDISGTALFVFVLIYLLAQGNNVYAALRGDPPLARPDELWIWTGASLLSLAALVACWIFSPP